MLPRGSTVCEPNVLGKAIFHRSLSSKRTRRKSQMILAFHLFDLVATFREHVLAYSISNIYHCTRENPPDPNRLRLLREES